MDTVFTTAKNWESDVHDVQIESCAVGEDPLGYRAVFYLSDSSPDSKRISFWIGASALAQRAKSLGQAGYNAPMTRKAIALVEGLLDAGTATCHV